MTSPCNQIKVQGPADLDAAVWQITRVQLGHAKRKEPIMNNEEKILEMLTSLTETVSRQGEQIAEMQTTLTRVAVTQEGTVLPRLQLLYEGHSELKRKMDTLATKEQVEELAGDVDVIKEVVGRHSGDINKLKKAR